MDRKWLDGSRLSKEYDNGVKYFIEFAEKYAQQKNLNKFFCPCVECCNMDLVDKKIAYNHLIVNGFDRNYKRWVWHGENDMSTNTGDNVVSGNVEDRHDWLEDMVRYVRKESVDKPEILGNLLSDNEKPLYPGCSSFTRLSAVLKLYNLKAGNGWSDASFSNLLQLLKEILPEGNELPDSAYRARKMLCPMGMEYRKIHACPNDCVLYIDEHKKADECPKCHTSRYKLKRSSEGDGDSVVQCRRPPAKVL